MAIYVITIFIFLIINLLLSGFLKKYTYEKFFIYVVIYFILVNLINSNLSLISEKFVL